MRVFGTRRCTETFATPRCSGAMAISQQVRNPCMICVGGGRHDIHLHASKNGQSVVTVRISLAVAVDKARVLESLGWQVHVTDLAGHQFTPSEFDWLSSLAGETT